MKIAVVDRYFEETGYDSRFGTLIKEVLTYDQSQINIIFDEEMHIIKNSNFYEDLQRILNKYLFEVICKQNALKIELELQELLYRYRKQNLLFFESELHSDEEIYILPKEKYFEQLLQNRFT